MSVYGDYTPDEQQLLRASLEAAAVAVSAASPGRKEETVSEGFAAATFVLESLPEQVGNQLVTSVIVELKARLEREHPFPDYLAAATEGGAREWAMDTLGSVARLLDGKASADEAAGYKGWLYGIATVTAKAGKEDQGFLGLGGVQVNEAERLALAEIAATLGIEAPGATDWM